MPDDLHSAYLGGNCLHCSLLPEQYLARAREKRDRRLGDILAVYLFSQGKLKEADSQRIYKETSFREIPDDEGMMRRRTRVPDGVNGKITARGC
jgi:hypothetical protein